MRTVCQPIAACSQDLGNPAGRWNTISDGVTQTSLFRVSATKEIGAVCTQATGGESSKLLGFFATNTHAPACHDEPVYGIN